MAAKPTRQLTYKTNSAKANKEKSNAHGGAGREWGPRGEWCRQAR